MTRTIQDQRWQVGPLPMGTLKISRALSVDLLSSEPRALPHVTHCLCAGSRLYSRSKCAWAGWLRALQQEQVCTGRVAPGSTAGASVHGLGDQKGATTSALVNASPALPEATLSLFSEWFVCELAPMDHRTLLPPSVLLSHCHCTAF